MESSDKVFVIVAGFVVAGFCVERVAYLVSREVGEIRESGDLRHAMENGYVQQVDRESGEVLWVKGEDSE